MPPRPGLITAFQPNALLSRPRGLSRRSGRGDAARIRGDRAAGFDLQLDCPDLAMSRHTGYQDLERGRVPQGRRGQCRGAQRRHREHPGRADAHARLLGQLRRPARSRHSAREGSRRSCSRRGPRRSCSRPPIRATSMSGSCGATRKLPEDKILAPGLIDTCLQLCRASRADRPAHRALRRDRRARPGDRKHRLRLRHFRRLRQDRSRGRLEEARGAARGRATCGFAGGLRRDLRTVIARSISDEAIQFSQSAGLLRFARNDRWGRALTSSAVATIRRAAAASAPPGCI